MRVAMMVAGAVAAAGMSAPVSAQNAQPGEIATYSQTITNYLGSSSQPFNTALGRLIGVHFDVTARSNVGYIFTPTTTGSTASILYYGASTYSFAGFTFGITGMASGLATGGNIITNMAGSQSLDLDPTPFQAGYRLQANGGDPSLSMAGSALLQPGTPTAIGTTTFVSDTAGILFKTAGYCGVSTGNDACSTAIGSLTFTYIVAGVPEPATWAMMLAGFGIVGAVFRRRHKAVVSFI